ncbi:MND1-interacting protein 1-like isoform X2 [Nymphaea colorata]|nr:MND1-interacting protein 1-like isoform X2 [Nymphaea colorata]
MVNPRKMRSHSTPVDRGDGDFPKQPSSRPAEFSDVGSHCNNPSTFHESDGSEWGLCNEQQLEGMLLRNLDFLYNEAIRRIVLSGFDEEIVMKAVLRNGHCYGNGDLLSNIIHNSLACLNGNRKDFDESGTVFRDLKQLEQYSLAGIICLLQQVRPQLTRGDAMWCLLMSDLHVGRASSFDFSIPSSEKSGETGDCDLGARNWAESPVGISVPTPIRPSPSNLLSATEVPQFCDTYSRLGLGSEDSAVNGFLNNATANGLNFGVGQSSNSFNMSNSTRTMKGNAASLFSSSFSEVPRAREKYTPLSCSVGCSHHSLTLCRQHRCRTGVWGLPQCSNLMKHYPSLVYENAYTTHMMNAGAGTTLPSESESESRISHQYCGKQRVTGNADVSSIVGNLENLQLDEKHDAVVEQRDEMVSKLTQQIEVLEKQLQERIEWAQQKALQAAKKLSNDLNELKTLRMERDDTLREKNKQPTESAAMSDLFKLEDALKKKMTEVDHANAVVKHLETENAEIRAEMVAAKLSANESVRKGLVVGKREKKCQKKILAWEKQNDKLQEQVIEEKQKNNQLQQQLHLIKETHKETELKWKHAMRAKELANSQVEKERRAKEAAEANSARRQEALCRKIEIDFQRYKDDVQRLEDDLSRLRTSSRSSDQLKSSSNLPYSTHDADVTKTSRGSVAKATVEYLKNFQESSLKEIKCDRECLICMKEEVSVVVLPCAHQVLCVGCNEAHEKLSEKNCPCCNTEIKQRIRVFGVIS